VTTEYRLVGVDAAGVWRALIHASHPDDGAARRQARRMLDEYPVVIIYDGERTVGMELRDAKPKPASRT
jgi:hypothetical protein